MITLLFLAATFAWATETSPEIANGEYLTRIAGCADCHSTTYTNWMSGGLPLATQFGTFYAPNLTPSVQYGIGNWSLNNFKRALREGRRPNGQFLFPVFPYRSYSKMTDGDIADIYGYFRSLQPIEQPSRRHELKAPFDQRWLVRFWQWLFLSAKTPLGPSQTLQNSGNRSPDWTRGAYLTEALAHCTECHTPRNDLGGLETQLWMSGGRLPDGNLAPNITSDSVFGRGRWSRTDWVRFLASGMNPENRSVRGEMALVIQNTSALTPSDREAMVSYLMSLVPIARTPK